MKINICFGNSNEYLNGYVNTNFVKSNNFENCHPENLDSIVDDGEADEILAINVLNYIEFKKTKDVLINWYKKLKYDGTIVISFFDFAEICRALTSGQLDVLDAKKLIYGEQNEGWQFFKSGSSLIELKKFFLSIGSKVEYCKIDGFISHIKVRRVK
jgi:hypothetical protein